MYYQVACTACGVHSPLFETTAVIALECKMCTFSVLMCMHGSGEHIPNRSNYEFGMSSHS